MLLSSLYGNASSWRASTMTARSSKDADNSTSSSAPSKGWIRVAAHAAFADAIGAGRHEGVALRGVGCIGVRQRCRAQQQGRQHRGRHAPCNSVHGPRHTSEEAVTAHSNWLHQRSANQISLRRMNHGVKGAL